MRNRRVQEPRPSVADTEEVNPFLVIMTRTQRKLLERTWLAVALTLLEAADEAERMAGGFD